MWARMMERAGAQPHSWHYLAIAQFLLLAMAAIILGIWWHPEPHSDWLYYWNAAGVSSAYERGGIGIWLLAIPKAMGASPLVAALFLNISALGWLFWLAYRLDGSRWRWLAQIVVAILFLIVPFMSLVQLDLIAATGLATAFWLLADERLALAARWRSLLVLLALAMGVSTKPQFALILWTLVGLGAMSGLLPFFRREESRGRRVLLILLVGSILGFLMDMGLRQLSGRTEQIRTSSAVTLYGGLLVSSDQPDQGCGYWSIRAAEAAREDLSRTLPTAVIERLQARPFQHWLSVMRCKAPEILNPPPFALYWLIESPNVRANINATPNAAEFQKRYYQALAVERLAYGWLKMAVFFACVLTILRVWRRDRLLSLLPMLWPLSFWCVHLVFEIQGRYFLSLFLLAPLLCMMVLRMTTRRDHEMAGTSNPERSGRLVEGTGEHA
ncbi:hypothetical protein [Pseudoxanthomonas sp. z9]|uniref:hypothetical protein n=1 Tax=Pseudoxanthomonas sp. z9 TaxID=2584942 RepID=UPI00114462CE|nr:hypothetical protein [Pseudoxanthomonas sp. z9]